MSDAVPLVHRYLAFQNKDIGATSCAFVDSRSRAFLSAVHGVESDLRPTEKTLFSIGSISKVFTAVAILQLVAAGKIALDDPFTKYLPTRLPWPDHPMGHWCTTESFQFTIKDALMHRTGLLREGGFLLDSPDPPINVSLMSVDPYPQSGIRNPTFSPEALYSNLGPQLLGQVIEAVTQGSRAVYMKENIFDPLRMHDTIVTDGWSRLRDRIPGYGHQDSDGNRELASNEDALAGAFPGASDIWSTAADMANLVEFMLRGNENVLPDVWRQKMLHTQWQDPSSSFNYSLGLWLPEDGFVHHGGHMEGFRCVLLLDREAGNGVVVLTNAMDSPVGWNQVPREILRALADAQGRDFGQAAVDFPERCAQVAGFYKYSRGNKEETFVVIGSGLIRHDLNAPTIISTPSVLRWYDDTILEVVDDTPMGYKHEFMFVEKYPFIEKYPTGTAIEHSFVSKRQGPIDTHPRVRTAPVRDLSWVAKSTTNSRMESRRRTAKLKAAAKPMPAAALKAATKPGNNSAAVASRRKPQRR